LESIGHRRLWNRRVRPSVDCTKERSPTGDALVTSTRILLASTAISLCSIGFSHALPTSPIRSLGMSEPMARYLINAQSSVADAQAALEAAIERQANAESSGGDVAQAQADVAAAQAELEAAQAAAQATTEAEPEAPAPAAETAPAPEASSPDATPVQPDTEGDAPAEQPPAPVSDDPETVAEEPTPETQPAATEETPADAPEPATDSEAASRIHRSLIPTRRRLLQRRTPKSRWRPPPMQNR
jgi:hypothetical protein